MTPSSPLAVLSGSAHPALADAVAAALGIAPVPRRAGRFPDGELDVEIEGGVGGRRVFVVQPLGAPVADNLLELLLLSDACRRCGAASVAAVVPYLGFARQDRIVREGRPLGARVVADVLGTGCFSRLVTLDLHSPAAASSVAAPVAHLTAVPALAAALRPLVDARSVVVAPDLGAVKLAETYARLLGTSLAAVSKMRLSPDEVAVRGVVGDVRGQRPILVDDMISTGATITAALDALRAEGCAPDVVVAATHAVLAGDALQRLSRPDIARVIVTDSLPPVPGAAGRIEVVPLAPLLAEAIRRIVDDRPLAELLAGR